jgi:hypothetical protein
MKTSFSSFYPYTDYLDSDHPSFYHIETFDNGIYWNLKLIHTRSGDTIDSINLEGHIRDVHPIWYNHLVIQARFNREDYVDDITDEKVAEIKAYHDTQNTTRLEDFITHHNATYLDTPMYAQVAY